MRNKCACLFIVFFSISEQRKSTQNWETDFPIFIHTIKYSAFSGDIMLNLTLDPLWLTAMPVYQHFVGTSSIFFSAIIFYLIAKHTPQSAKGFAKYLTLLQVLLPSIPGVIPGALPSRGCSKLFFFFWTTVFWFFKCSKGKKFQQLAILHSQASITLVDIVYCFLVSPIHLYPLPGMLCRGILCVWFGFSGHIGLVRYNRSNDSSF